jgi:hypothetical protein
MCALRAVAPNHTVEILKDGDGELGIGLMTDSGIVIQRDGYRSSRQ